LYASAISNTWLDNEQYSIAFTLSFCTLFDDKHAFLYAIASETRNLYAAIRIAEEVFAALKQSELISLESKVTYLDSEFLWTSCAVATPLVLYMT
jgi:hypothetical protein